MSKLNKKSLETLKADKGKGNNPALPQCTDLIHSAFIFLSPNHEVVILKNCDILLSIKKSFVLCQSYSLFWI